MCFFADNLTRLDGKDVFKKGFSRLEENLNNRQYTSVTIFSEHFSSVINETLRTSPRDESGDAHSYPQVEDSTKDSLPDYKYRKALVTRIVKAVKTPFEDALRKESELCKKPFEKELASLDRLLENSQLSRRNSLGGEKRESSTIQHSHETGNQDSSAEVDVNGSLIPFEESNQRQQPPAKSLKNSNGTIGDTYKENDFGLVNGRSSAVDQSAESLTSPVSFRKDSQPMSHGGVPWYMVPFDPVGTTVEEERWTGRELVRGMSEELSDMDEEELSTLVVDEGAEGPSSAEIEAELARKARAKKRKAANARRRRAYG